MKKEKDKRAEKEKPEEDPKAAGKKGEEEPDSDSEQPSEAEIEQSATEDEIEDKEQFENDYFVGEGKDRVARSLDPKSLTEIRKNGLERPREYTSIEQPEARVPIPKDEGKQLEYAFVYVSLLRSGMPDQDIEARLQNAPELTAFNETTMKRAKAAIKQMEDAGFTTEQLAGAAYSGELNIAGVKGGEPKTDTLVLLEKDDPMNEWAHTKGMLGVSMKKDGDVQASSAQGPRAASDIRQGTHTAIEDGVISEEAQKGLEKAAGLTEKIPSRIISPQNVEKALSSPKNYTDKSKVGDPKFLKPAVKELFVDGDPKKGIRDEVNGEKWSQEYGKEVGEILKRELTKNPDVAARILFEQLSGQGTFGQEGADTRAAADVMVTPYGMKRITLEYCKNLIESGAISIRVSQKGSGGGLGRMTLRIDVKGKQSGTPAIKNVNDFLSNVLNESINYIRAFLVEEDTDGIVDTDAVRDDLKNNMAQVASTVFMAQNDVSVEGNLFAPFEEEESGHEMNFVTVNGKQFKIPVTKTMEDDPELTERVVSLQTRKKMARAARRTAKKRARVRKRKQKFKKTEGQIQKKANKDAKMIIRKKILGDKNWSDMSISQRARVDKLLQKKQKAVKRIAKKLLPKTKKAERERLQRVRGNTPGQPANVSDSYKYTNPTIEENKMADEKPLMKWMATFRAELKKLGSSYGKVKPEDALKLYYKKIDPKRAAKQLKESVELTEKPSNEMRETGRQMLRSMPKDMKSKVEKGQYKVVASAPSWLGGNSEFQVLKWSNKPNVDPYIMVIVSNPKRKPMQVFAYYGTHPSRNAIQFAKGNGLLESVELDEGSLGYKRALRARKKNPKKEKKMDYRRYEKEKARGNIKDIKDSVELEEDNTAAVAKQVKQAVKKHTTGKLVVRSKGGKARFIMVRADKIDNKLRKKVLDVAYPKANVRDMDNISYGNINDRIISATVDVWMKALSIKESADLDECWDTHVQKGMKMKGGKMVPNCVPKESVEEAAIDLARVPLRTPKVKTGIKKSTGIRLVLPNAPEVKAKMDRVLKKDAKFRRQMANLVVDRETRGKDLVLYFKSTRGREKFHQLLNMAEEYELAETVARRLGRVVGKVGRHKATKAIGRGLKATAKATGKAAVKTADQAILTVKDKMDREAERRKDERERERARDERDRERDRDDRDRERKKKELASKREKLSKEREKMDEVVNLSRYRDKARAEIQKRDNKFIVKHRDGQYISKMDGNKIKGVLNDPDKAMRFNKRDADRVARIERGSKVIKLDESTPAYRKMMKNYAGSDMKKVFDILKPKGFRVGQQDDVMVRNLLKKHKNDVKKVAAEIEKKYSNRFKESLDERKMTAPEIKKKEEIVKALKRKKGDFDRRYGDVSKNVMYATATKNAMKDHVEVDEDTVQKKAARDAAAKFDVEIDKIKQKISDTQARMDAAKSAIQGQSTLDTLRKQKEAATKKKEDAKKKIEAIKARMAARRETMRDHVELDERRQDVYAIVDKNGKVVSSKLTKKNAHKEIAKYRYASDATIVLDPDAKDGDILKAYAKKKNKKSDPELDLRRQRSGAYVSKRESVDEAIGDGKKKDMRQRKLDVALAKIDKTFKKPYKPMTPRKGIAAKGHERTRLNPQGDLYKDIGRGMKVSDIKLISRMLKRGMKPAEIRKKGYQQKDIRSAQRYLKDDVNENHASLADRRAYLKKTVDDRKARVKARREMIKQGRASVGDGKDVDHKNGNPQDNSSTNLRMSSVNHNRSRNNNEENGAGDEGTKKLLKKYKKDTPGSC